MPNPPITTTTHSNVPPAHLPPNPGPVAHPISMATVITFDDVADGTAVDSHYTAQGVTFASVTTSPPNRWSAYARRMISASAPNGISVQALPHPPSFDVRSGGIEASFTHPQRWVAIDAQPWPQVANSTANPSARPLLEAFDAQGQMIAKVFYPLSFGQPGYGDWKTLIITAPTASIVKVIFTSEFSGPPSVESVFDRFAFLNAVPTVPYPIK